MQFLKGQTPEMFFQNYWERKFLHIPNAIDIPSEAILESDILDMVNDEYFETRLIRESAKNIDVSDGPLNLNAISELQGKWILMVHNLNLYNQFAHKLEKKVEFIPKWLFDDVMLSYSSKESTINAHVDKYNVFILQVKGQRKWSIQNLPNQTYQEDCDLKILKNFTPDKEIILNPGDMIYIPPEVAHEGYSLTDSMSVSIGFKSLEDQPMLENFLVKKLENLASEEYFKTHFEKNNSNDPYLIDDSTMDKIHTRLLQQLTDKNKFKKWLNNYLSIPKVANQRPDELLNKAHFLAEIKTNQFSLDEHIRMNYFKDENTYYVAVNDLQFELNPNQYLTFKELINNKHLELDHNLIAGIKDLAFLLYQNGLINILES